MQGLHPSLTMPPSNLIGGHWAPIPGSALQSRPPADPGSVLWSGSPVIEHVDGAVTAARAAAPQWAAASFDDRAAVLRRFQKLCTAQVDRMAALIRDEVGKASWDARAEAQLLAGKVEITLEPGPNSPLNRVRDFDLPLSPTRVGRCRFRPHGVVAVLGPFNFPAHLPNGHIVPALAMGNTIVFKPSDKAPACGQALAELFEQALRDAGAPAGVFNLVQGGVDVAKRLAHHDDLDAILFTGSWPVGRSILEANLSRPGRLLALEMGGDNAAIIMPDADLPQAVVESVRSAFVTAGQRCTCTRRLIVHRGVADRVIPAITRAARSLVVGDPREPVFMGPLISRGARKGVLDAQAALARHGGQVILPCDELVRPGAAGPSGWYLSPGIVKVDRFVGHAPPDAAHIRTCGDDLEIFGPLLRVSIAGDLDDALEQANATSFGLAGAIFTRDRASIDRFLDEARAGCLNINAGTAGASSKLPFGGLGLSGNHRPAGAFSLDSCAYPVAAMIESGTDAPLPVGMTFDRSWIA